MRSKASEMKHEASILAYLADGGEHPKSEIFNRVEGSTVDLSDAVKRMVADGRVVVRQHRITHLVSLAVQGV